MFKQQCLREILIYFRWLLQPRCRPHQPHRQAVSLSKRNKIDADTAFLNHLLFQQSLGFVTLRIVHISYKCSRAYYSDK